AKHSCWSSAPAKDGRVLLQYRLETFTEFRATEWSKNLTTVADFYTQPAPRPWEVPATPPSHFTNQTTEIRVPFTSSIKECHQCRAMGTMQCVDCRGDGKKQCWVCKGAGTRDTENCSHCNVQRPGTKECDICKGKRQLLAFINLKVEWYNLTMTWRQSTTSSTHQNTPQLHFTTKLEHRSAHECLLPDSVFVSQLYPLVGFPNPAISEASERMVRDHQSKYAQNSKILQQVLLLLLLLLPLLLLHCI
uniref:Uncharacterized protein n=1 Tax=Neogobius melanostomus TaxID=47308 RepID=A0A8C6UCN1_9GOBI